MTQLAASVQSPVFRRLRYGTARAFYRAWRAMGGPDFLDELDYWEGYLKKRPASLSDPGVRKAAFPAGLRAHAARIRKEEGRLARVLEIGSGPFSLLASGVDEGIVTVTALDPLARSYADLLKLCGVDFPVRPVPGRGEDLSRFAARSFDIVYSSNALDHSASPRRCIEQMCEMLPAGGVLLLEGFVREGSQGNWIGLHQHDLFTEQGQLIHVDRQGHRTNLAAQLPLEYVSDHVCQFKDRNIQSFGYELNVPLNPANAWDWRFRDWYTVVFRKVPKAVQTQRSSH